MITNMAPKMGTMTGKAKLAHMANQIAAFFGTAVPYDEAVEGIADHLNKFWEPRMRRQFFEIIDQGGAGLSLLVKEAAAKVRRPSGATTQPFRS